MYLAGTSILEDTLPYIQELAIDKGVNILTEFKSHDIIKHMISLNTSHLTEDSSDDTLVLSFLGNYLFDKDDFDNYHPEGENTWHLINTSIPMIIYYEIKCFFKIINYINCFYYNE